MKADGSFDSDIRDPYSRGHSSLVATEDRGDTVYGNILSDMRRVRGILSEELNQLESNKASDREKENRLLFLFHCDLMPPSSARILKTKRLRDERFSMASNNRVERWQYVLAWIVIAAVVIGSTIYILSFGRRQCPAVQEAWFWSFVILLALDMFVVSTVVVFVQDIFIPLLVLRDVAAIRDHLNRLYREYRSEIERCSVRTSIDSGEPVFNMANHLFVSVRLSQKFPNLEASKIISRYSSVWPQQPYGHFRSLRPVLSSDKKSCTRMGSTVRHALSLFLGMPPLIQDSFVSLISMVVSILIIVAAVALWELNPFCSFGLLVGILFFCYVLSKSFSRINNVVSIEQINNIVDLSNTKSYFKIQQAMRGSDVLEGGDITDHELINETERGSLTICDSETRNESELNGASTLMESNLSANICGYIPCDTKSLNSTCLNPFNGDIKALALLDWDHSEYYCPISFELMDDPVFCSDGSTYNRTSIETWFLTHHTSPLTGARLENKSLVPNLVLRSLICTVRQRKKSLSTLPVHEQPILYDELNINKKIDDAGCNDQIDHYFSNHDHINDLEYLSPSLHRNSLKNGNFKPDEIKHNYAQVFEENDNLRDKLSGFYDISAENSDEDSSFEGKIGNIVNYLQDNEIDTEENLKNLTFGIYDISAENSDEDSSVENMTTDLVRYLEYKRHVNRNEVFRLRTSDFYDISAENSDEDLV